jgi:hypothetical protein
MEQRIGRNETLNSRASSLKKKENSRIICFQRTSNIVHLRQQGWRRDLLFWRPAIATAKGMFHGGGSSVPSSQPWTLLCSRKSQTGIVREFHWHLSSH